MKKLIINNKLELIGIPPEVTKQLINSLTFSNPVYEEAVKYGRYLRNINPRITLYSTTLDGIIIPRGFLEFVEKNLLNKGYNFIVEDHRIFLPPISVESNIKLRPYQQKAKSDLLKHSNGMLVAPAGSGKTVIGLDVFTTLKQKTLWLTHTNKLFDQIAERILEMFPCISKEEIGSISADKIEIGDSITIGMIPTLARRDLISSEISKEFGLVMIDECHHLAATTFVKVASYFPSYYLYAFTASPRRRDGLENMLYATAGPPNAVIKRAEVEKEGGIITPKLVTRWIPSPQPYEGNDFNYIINELIIPNRNRLLLIVNDIVQEARDGKYCIVISTRKQYCEMLFEETNKHWDKTAIATGDYSRKANREATSKIESGEATVLICTGALLAEGFDIRKLDREFIVLPLSGRGTLLEQYIGRVQRTCENKEDAIIFDYVDNIGILQNQFRRRTLVYSHLGIKEKKSM